LDVSLLSTIIQTITCKVRIIVSQVCFVATCVYGHNERVHRYALWEDLVIDAQGIGASPWVLMGDFNIVRFPDERCGDLPVDLAEMDDFNKYVNDIQMYDMNTKGFFYTWRNKRDNEAHIMSRIDRVLVNDMWLQVFPNVEAEVVAEGVSDHSPLIISITTPAKRGGKPFKFFSFWMRHNSFKQVLKDSWDQPSSGYAMYQVFTKLKRLKVDLKKLKHEFYSNITLRVKVVKADLVAQQCLMQQGRVTTDMRNKETTLLQIYVSLCAAEEEFMKQKFRIKWLQCKDKNTSYFHKKVNAHRARNKIMSI